MSSQSKLDPVSPLIFMVGGNEAEEEEAELDRSGVFDDEAQFDNLRGNPWVDMSEFECKPCDDGKVIVDSDVGPVQLARSAPEIKAPSIQEQRRHNLTHYPYASWCPWCVMGRKPNAPHFQCRDRPDRSLPLIVLDYAQVRNKEDEVLAQLLIGKVYPMRKFFACICDAKGVDPYVVERMATFIRDTGLNNFNFVVKSDQESSIVAMMEQAIRRSGRNGTAVPEASAVGESASNGRAERAVQTVEDLLRVHKIALEARIGVHIPADHAVLRWMVEHVADVLNKYSINSTGMSPYEELHGRKAQEIRVEFGGISFLNDNT